MRLWWRGNLTQTALKKIKPWDREELSRREKLARLTCEEELKKVDWEMMKKHLHTPEAVQAYEHFCNLSRKGITDNAVRVINLRRPDPYLQYCYGNNAYLPFRERVRLEWDCEMKQLKRLQKIPLVSKKSGVLIAAAVLSAAGVVDLGYWILSGNVNEQKKEKQETA